MEGAGIEQRSVSSVEEATLHRKLSSLSLLDPAEAAAAHENGNEEEEEEHEDSSYEEHDESRDSVGELFVPGPVCSLKDHWERDKEDESLQRWKKQLLGFADYELHGDTIDPEVTVLSLGIMSKGYPEITLQLPLDKSSNDVCFTLKEGSSYHLKFTFMVQHNIVCGLAYSNTVWKGRIRVDQTQGMLGTFSPQQEPYTYVMEENTTPKGVLARGFYTAKTKFVDDDGRCYLEVHYTFEIQKDWKDKKSINFSKVSMVSNNKAHKKQWLVRSLSHQLNFPQQFKKKENSQRSENQISTYNNEDLIGSH